MSNWYPHSLQVKRMCAPSSVVAIEPVGMTERLHDERPKHERQDKGDQDRLDRLLHAFPGRNRRFGGRGKRV